MSSQCRTKSIRVLPVPHSLNCLLKPLHRRPCPHSIFPSQNKSVFEIAVELNRLQELGLSGRLLPADISGGTFSLSNIGVVSNTLLSPSTHVAIQGRKKRLLSIEHLANYRLRLCDCSEDGVKYCHMVYNTVTVNYLLEAHPLQLEVRYRMLIYKPTRHYKPTPLFRADVWGSPMGL